MPFRVSTNLNGILLPGFPQTEKQRAGVRAVVQRLHTTGGESYPQRPVRRWDRHECKIPGDCQHIIHEKPTENAISSPTYGINEAHL